MKGYARAVGCTTSVATELWVLRDSIRLCISLKLPAVIVELDAQLLVDLLKKDGDQSNSYGAFLSDCKARLRQSPMVRVQHCYWEANKCAYVLARRRVLLP